MLRKVLETSLHEGLKEYEGTDKILFGENNQPYKLSKRLKIIRDEYHLMSDYLVKKLINQVIFSGDLAAHDHSITIHKQEFEDVNFILSKALEHYFTKIKEFKNSKD